MTFQVFCISDIMSKKGGLHHGQPLKPHVPFRIVFCANMVRSLTMDKLVHHRRVHLMIEAPIHGICGNPQCTPNFAWGRGNSHFTPRSHIRCANVIFTEEYPHFMCIIRFFVATPLFSVPMVSWLFMSFQRKKHTIRWIDSKALAVILNLSCFARQDLWCWENFWGLSTVYFHYHDHCCVFPSFQPQTANIDNGIRNPATAFTF